MSLLPHPDDLAMFDAVERANGGRYPDDAADFAAALQKVQQTDPALAERFSARMEIRQCLRKPLVDTTGFGGWRGSDATAMPLAKAAAVAGRADLMPQDASAISTALDRLSGRALAASRVGVEGARSDADFGRPCSIGQRGRGSVLAKRGSTAERLAENLQEILTALQTPLDY